MTIKKFSTKLSALAHYTSNVANIYKGKMKTFTNGLRSNITKNMLIGDNPPKFYTKTLRKTFRFVVMR